MNTLKIWWARYANSWLLALGCILVWYISSRALEQYQASIGPDFLARIPLKILNVAIVGLLTRTAVRKFFPTVYSFTTTKGGTEQSEFTKQWHHSPADQRLWISVLVYLGVLFVLSQLLLS